MMRTALHKRLDTIEQSFGRDTYIVVWRGLPPYVVVVQHLREHSRDEPFLINTPEELDAYLASLPKSTNHVIIDFGDMPSSEAYSLAQ